MISSEISKRLTEGLKKLRAITEPTTDTDPGISVSYYAEHNSAAVEEEVFEKTQDHLHQLTFWDQPGYYEEQDFCYAKKTIDSDEYNKFYQDIAQEAKEWTDKPSDRKKISQAIEYVLELSKTAPKVNNKLSDRLKHDEMMRIVSKLVEYIKD